MASALAKCRPRVANLPRRSRIQHVDHYAILDAAGCGATVGTTDDVTVSTSKDDCLVNDSGPTYANWAAFAAANPDWKVAKKDIVFIEADQPGDYHVFDFQFG